MVGAVNIPTRRGTAIQRVHAAGDNIDSRVTHTTSTSLHHHCGSRAAGRCTRARQPRVALAQPCDHVAALACSAGAARLTHHAGANDEPHVRHPLVGAQLSSDPKNSSPGASRRVKLSFKALASRGARGAFQLPRVFVVCAHDARSALRCVGCRWVQLMHAHIGD
jgi:hypothetical protein